MTENDSSSSSHYSKVGYKLKDPDGVIVDSGTGYINPMSVGETAKDSICIWNPDLNLQYSLELDNVPYGLRKGVQQTADSIKRTASRCGRQSLSC